MTVILLFITLLSSGTNLMGTVTVGSHVPTFVLPDQNGNPFDISTVIGKKNLVIYFYPKDDTPGCIKEGCKFRDEYEAFKEADAEVIGISSDDAESHRKFAEKYRLPYTLLCDTEGRVRKLFDVPSTLFGLIPGRVTYVVDKRGIVIHIFDSQSQAERHIDEALKALKGLQKND